jgi:hypothetical protein
MNIRLRDNMDDRDGWGQAQGLRVRDKLRTHIEAHPKESIIRISLADVRYTDITFPRTAVIELAKSYRGKRGFCLIDVSDPDLLENWDAAAKRVEQPLTVWKGKGDYDILGPEPSAGLHKMLQYVLSISVARTSEAAETLNLKIQNASNKLKQLWQEGYILRREQSASSGGVEYEYIRIA